MLDFGLTSIARRTRKKASQKKRREKPINKRR